MSIRVMTHIWQHSKHKGSDLLLLLAIADFASDEGVAFPSVPTLAAKTRLTVRNVQLRLRQLAKSNELAIHLNEGPGGVHLYHILGQGVKSFQGESIEKTESAQTGGEKFSGGVKSFQVKPTSPGGEAHFTGGVKPTSPRSVIEPSDNRQKKITPSETSEVSSGVPRAQAPRKSRPPTADPAPTSLVWNAYAHEYQDRYGVPPVRNPKVNAQLKQFVQRVPQEAAPHIAAFYVWHASAYYQTRGHPVGLLLADAEKLHTEWKTHRQILATQARQQEKTASNPFLPLLERLEKEAADDER